MDNTKSGVMFFLVFLGLGMSLAIIVKLNTIERKIDAKGTLLSS